MPGDPFKKVQSGQPLAIPAAAYNAFVDAARDHQARQRGTSAPSRLIAQEPDIIVVRNDTGADRDRFDAVGLGAPVITPTDNLPEFKNRIVLKGETPGVSHAGFAILQEPIPAGKFGLAVASGVSVVQINVQSGDTGDTADVESGSYKLRLGSGPAVVLWREGGTGDQWAVVRIGGGESCPDRNEIHQLTVIGRPTGGTLDMELTVNSVGETMTFNWNDTAAAVETELETHTEIAAGDVAVSGGPLPNATIQIDFLQNLAATAVQLPTLDWSALTGGTGVAAIASRPQSGFPN